MEKGLSKSTEYIYKYYLSESNILEDINHYINDSINENFENADENNLGLLFELDYSKLDIDALHAYCAPVLSRYENINTALRGNWDYGYHGKEELKKDSLELAERIDKSILLTQEKHKPFYVYRGVDIKTFSDYGISQLEDLVLLEGKIMYDSGFQSTALLENKSYFNKKDSFDNLKNIKIIGEIPSKFRDGLYLDRNITLSSLEYDPGEYLISSGTLSFVKKVEFNRENNTASIYVIYIPKLVWDIDYRNIIQDNNTKLNF